MERLAIYPGSFDPVTNGHLDILSRALRLFDRVVIAIAENVAKQGLFTPQERVELLRRTLAHEPRVEVDLFSGLLVDYVVRRKANAVVRGLRAVADFEYEFQLALMNRRLAPELDTVFLMTDETNFYVSSSLVKEVARFGGDVTAFVPATVLDALRAKLALP
ncbi:MAG: pantetheine-phosphate adenylyltransferase [Deltaproteobacteria bacterium]|nr:pantetheine-phosphate adenylyltransferase [Deltaproteobacteria bacterium]